MRSIARWSRDGNTISDLLDELDELDVADLQIDSANTTDDDSQKLDEIVTDRHV